MVISVLELFFNKKDGVRLPFFNPGINMKSFTIKQITMKKLFVVLAIGAFAACNGSSSTEAKVDSTATAAKTALLLLLIQLRLRQLIRLQQLLRIASRLRLILQKRNSLRA